ncbi:Sec-independent protein translocase protein TatB [Microbulbifer celer]|uniref:Sec-independent protein translocase protein TatB n=1 Tax=Microbulbifer celer TaxID=435905 RepID=A0ABW3UBP9_9GAMM|nr:Sec-independent protein translocase protein TatB [Microbulbifer celer]UFN57175.1 Sec-independent protein translocase protein TatB [Microbulbifer celer]
MFDIGFFELLLVGVVGLVVIGPERLPDAVRTTVRWWTQLKQTLGSAREELEREVGADDIRRELHNERVLRELQESKAEMERTFRKAENKFEQDLQAVTEQQKSDSVREGEDYLPEQGSDDKIPEEYLPEDEEDDSDLEDPEYPEHLHDHGDPEFNPHHPDHFHDEAHVGGSREVSDTDSSEAPSNERPESAAQDAPDETDKNSGQVEDKRS